MDVKSIITKLTLINCAEEDIKEHTNKERAHRHLPTKMMSNDDMNAIFNRVK